MYTYIYIYIILHGTPPSEPSPWMRNFCGGNLQFHL